MKFPKEIRKRIRKGIKTISGTSRQLERKSNDQLCYIIKKHTGMRKVEAARILLERDPNNDQLRCVIEYGHKGIKDPSLVKEAMKIQKVAVKKRLERGLDEPTLFTILNEVESLLWREKAVRKYRSENEKLSDYVLMKIIEKVPKLVEEIGWTLLEQTSDPDALLAIVQEAEAIAPKLQREALEKLRPRIDLDDACYLIWSVPSVAWQVFQRLRQGGKIQKLSEEQLRELRLSDHPKISHWATKKLTLKLKEKREKLFRKREENLREIDQLRQLNENERIEWEIFEIDQELEKLKGELKRMKKLDAGFASFFIVDFRFARN